MRSNDLLQNGNILVMNSAEPRTVELGKLPLGHFTYRFYTYNPSGVSCKLAVSFSGKDWRTGVRTIELGEQGGVQVCHFDTLTAFEYCRVEFSCDGGDEVHLRLPVSAILSQSTEELPVFLFGLEEKIGAVLDGMEQDRAGGGWKKQGMFVDGAGLQSGSAKDIQAYVEARYFKGFLSVDEAARQLDHVVFHKLFNTDGDRGFVKFKKKVYRKVLKGIYRLLIKNRSRKMYMAKLYCNYLNMGTLAENLQ